MGAYRLPTSHYFFRFDHCAITFRRVDPDDPLELARRAGNPPLAAVFDVLRDGAEAGQVRQARPGDGWTVWVHGANRPKPMKADFLEDAAEIFAR